MNTKQIKFTFPALTEAEQYLDSKKWGSFSVLSGAGGRKRQQSYRLSAMPQVIQCCVADRSKDYWISQASFKKWNRRKVNLKAIALLFADIDYYHHAELAPLGAEAMVVEQVLPRCEALGIPPPSVIIDSGRGLQLKWFHEALPAQALPRWDAVMSRLNAGFLTLGADANAKDASRVLRLVQTVNQRSGTPVRLVHISGDWDTPIHYSFERLCSALLPFSQEQVRTYRHRSKSRDGRKKAASVASLGAARLSLDQLNWSRLCDLQKIVQGRGEVGDGLREPFAFWMCNHYALRYYASGIPDQQVWHEFYQLCRVVAPHWHHSKVREKTSHLLGLMKRAAKGETNTFNGKEYIPLYTPTNQYLLDALQITPDEERLMSTVISQSEKKRRHALSEQTRRRESGAVSRAEYEAKRTADSSVKALQAQRLRSQGLSIRDIAREMGVSSSSVHRYL